MDLIERLREIEQRAARARREITAGREAGLPVNGISALHKIEVQARDLAKTLETQTGGPEGPPAVLTTPSSRTKGA